MAGCTGWGPSSGPPINSTIDHWSICVIRGAMSEEQIVRDKLQSMGRYIKAQLPNGDWGFILLAFPYDAKGNLLYIASTQRDDAVQAMREFIAKNTEREKFTKDAFTDRTEVGADHAFDTWWKKEVNRIDGRCPTEWSTVRQLAFDAFIAGMVWSVA